MIEILRFDINEKRQREVGKILGEYIEDIEVFTNEEIREVLDIAFEDLTLKNIMGDIRLEKLESLGLITSRILTDEEVKKLELENMEREV